ncbi:hypothetical protein HH308_28420 [Gordonia sp. TBRC 11910]|uniref:IrrE N-terminal-like domain-containing protein n=1 Tax=Gordonia asplenii TaxID=2725283 RepID=A0A848LC56_9ACTN|nr:hypothetical protein [Gordonia asplenii]NMO05148.1 hypothetical protein [Gordonia asplenii]
MRVDDTVLVLPPVGARWRRATIRRRTRKVLRDLDLPASGVTPPILASAIAEKLGTAIELVEHALPARGPSGATFVDDSGYVVFFQSQTSVTHQAHHIIHELAHVLTGTFASVAQPTPPDVDCEEDMELIASIIACLVGLRAERVRSPEPTPTLTRLAVALDDYAERW